MKSVTKDAENVDSKGHSTANNNAASTESAPKSIPERGGEERLKDKWIKFSPELAESLGGKDGIICSVLAYGLYLWLKTPTKKFGYNPKIDGRKACYRSTRQLMTEYSLAGKSLWNDTTIFNALKRMARKSG